jgi:polyphosphate kinase
MNSEFYINRELSWLEFNKRVLDEAENKENPLMERIKFLSIFCSNFDEFFNVRVGSLRDMVNAGYIKEDPAGLNPKHQLKAISIKAQELSSELYRLYRSEIVPELEKNNIFFLAQDELTNDDKKYLHKYFNEMVFPVLTPHAVDCSRPFPHLQDKTLNLGVFLKKDDPEAEKFFATVQIPSILPRMVFLPTKNKVFKIFLLEDLISMHINDLFLGHEIISVNPYRIIRNADLTIEEEEAEDLLREIENSIRQRKWGQAVKLEVRNNVEDDLCSYLTEELDIHQKDVYYQNGPLNLSFLMGLYNLPGFDQLKDPKFTPVNKDIFKGRNIFSVIKEQDVLLHHPYDSFNPVLDFIDQAAKDPKVLAIKQTLYRVSGNSPVIKSLINAAENGKQVTVLVELKARFDEEKNIIWARRLEKAGCHVIYGLVGLKTHSKITLILRKEGNSIKRYVHLATGNYNDITAKLYTDIGMFTSNERFGQDASKIFNMLSGYSEIENLEKIIIAPMFFRNAIEKLISKEIENAEKGKRAEIIIKVNSLVDSKVIDLLYKASQKGVQIYLIVRGVCSLRPGIPGISDNIVVKSIVGRFLEHSRIFWFYNDGDEKYFLSSADLMTRNLDRRVEIFFPVLEKELKKELWEILQGNIKDNVKGKLMLSDGTYVKDVNDKEKFSIQDYLMDKKKKESK